MFIPSLETVRTFLDRASRRTGLLAAGPGLSDREDPLLRDIVENTLDGILIIGGDGRLVLTNSAARDAFRLSAATPPDLDIGQLIPDLRGGPKGSASGRSLSMAEGRRELPAVRADGEAFTVELSVSRIGADRRGYFVALVRDVTDRKAYEQQLEFRALHDSLTGLPNRTLLMDRLNRALAAAVRGEKPLAVLLLDLDRFKIVNDTLGHHVGDVLLCEVAERLAGLLRRNDTVARLGGDEFAVLLPAITNVDKAIEVAARIVVAFEAPFTVSDVDLDVGISIGIALFPNHATDAARLLQCADLAMYTAKRGQLGMSLYDFENDPNTIRSLALTGELRRAIEEDQLNLVYQPKVDLRTMKISGAEVLARWRHPVHGDIPPDEFVAQAEITGLILPLTRWVLDTALAQLVELEGSGIEIDLAVNLSTKTLLEDDLPDVVGACLRRQGVAARRLTLEITEDALMDNPETALATVKGLDELGVRLSIDDFGTGYSSLSYLKRVPLKELKIDQGFVSQMHEDRSDVTIVRSTIDLAHNLGLAVVAEGIERDVHVRMLRELGCDIGQGYFFSHPLTGDELVRWIDGGQASTTVTDRSHAPAATGMLHAARSASAR